MAYELLYGEKPSYEHLRVFGSLCFVHAKSRDKDKFGSRSRRCVFLGYPFSQKGWKVFDLETEEFLISRDVIFKETEFSFSSQSSAPTMSQLPTQIPLDDDWEITNLSPIVDRGSSVSVSSTPVSSTDQITTSQTEEQIDSPDKSPSSPAQSSQEGTVQKTTDSVSAGPESPINIAQPETSGHGRRARVPSVKLKDYVTYNAVSLEDPFLSRLFCIFFAA